MMQRFTREANDCQLKVFCFSFTNENLKNLDTTSNKTLEIYHCNTTSDKNTSPISINKENYEKNIKTKAISSIALEIQSITSSIPYVIAGSTETGASTAHQVYQELCKLGHLPLKLYLISTKKYQIPPTSSSVIISSLSSHNELPKLLSQEIDSALIQKWNNASMDYPSESCLHELFTQAAARTPNNVAVVYNDTCLTFKELDYQTNILASVLIKQYGVEADKIVGIYMEHCVEYVIAYIAALKAGGAYMPIEIVYPPELLQTVLADAKPLVVLTKSNFTSRLVSYDSVLSLDSDWLESTTYSSDWSIPKNTTTPDNLGFVVMSSGTTGAPKGICVPHRAAVHSYNWRLVTYPYDQAVDRVACHVFFVWELLRPLLGNVPLYVIPDDIIYDPYNLVAYLCKNRITRVLLTPSLLTLVLDTIIPEGENNLSKSLANLKIIWLCGEVVTSELALRVTTMLPHIKLLNLYSVSECHDVSCIDLSSVSSTVSKFASCGNLIPNVKAFILDGESLEPVPLGSSGELFIAGPVLARGYLNQPKKTSERFITKNNVRMYRTGDRAIYRVPSGEIELLGRCDYMVKIRGYSVVLGAIEAALTSHDGISTAVVVTEGEEGQDKILVAYVVPTDWTNILPSSKALATFLKDLIPHYAIPSVFIVLDSLPINDASGKLDRKALPRTSDTKVSKLRAFSNDLSSSGEAKSELQLTVASHWKELLKLEGEVELDMDFFEIGGHSLLASRLFTQLKNTLCQGITLKDILSYSTLRQMSSRIDDINNNGSATSTIRTVDLAAEASSLDVAIYPAPTRKSGYSRLRTEMMSIPPRRVFLTGGTGFLGSHLVASLIKQPHVTLYCLVRATDEEKAMERLEASLRHYKLLDKEETLHNAVVPVIGDLSKPLFGMTHVEFKTLAAEIDSIIHNAAAVNLVSSYASLKAVNVLGTQEVLRLAVTNGLASTRVKPVHYISTNGVFDTSNGGIATENVLPKCNVSDGYGQSKWVAEQLVIDARTRGLPVSILRPGNMAPSTATCVWNPDDFYYLLLSGVKKIGGVTPECPNWKFDMTPVDFAAEAIVFLTTTKPVSSLGRILHIQNPLDSIPASQVFSKMRLDDKKCVSFEEFKNLIQDEKKLGAGIDSFDSYLGAEFKFDTTELQNALQGSGINYPEINSDLLQRYYKSIL